MRLVRLWADGIYGHLSYDQQIPDTAVVFGPNGAGKSTLLGLVLLAVQGPSGTNYPVLGTSPSYPWSVIATFDDGAQIRRWMLEDGKHRVSFTPPGRPPFTSIREAQAEITAHLGRAASWSLAAFNSATALDRLKLLNDLLDQQGFGREATEAALTAAGTTLQAVLNVSDHFALDAASGVLHARILELDREVRATTGALGALPPLKATLPGGSVSTWRARVADLDTEIGQIEQERGESRVHQRIWTSQRLALEGNRAHLGRVRGEERELVQRLEELNLDRLDEVARQAAAARDRFVPILESKRELFAQAEADLAQREHAYHRLLKLQGGEAWDQDVDALTQAQLPAEDGWGQIKVEPYQTEDEDGEVKNLGLRIVIQPGSGPLGLKTGPIYRAERWDEVADAATRVLGLGNVGDLAVVEVERDGSRTRHDAVERSLQRQEEQYETLCSEATSAAERAQSAHGMASNLRQRLAAARDQIAHLSQVIEAAETETVIDPAAQGALEERLAEAQAARASAQANADLLSDQAGRLAEEERLRAAQDAATKRRGVLRDLLDRVQAAHRSLLEASTGELLEPANQIVRAVLDGAEIVPDFAEGVVFRIRRPGRTTPLAASRSEEAVAMAALTCAARRRMPGWKLLVLDDLEHLQRGRRTRLLRALDEHGALDNLLCACVEEDWAPPSPFTSICLELS